MDNKPISAIHIITAGFLSFLATLATAEAFLFILWLVGDLTPTYQLITGTVSGYIGLFVGGWITSRVMDTHNIWYSAFNGFLVGGISAYYLLGPDLLVIGIALISILFAGLGGYLASKRKN